MAERRAHESWDERRDYWCDRGRAATRAGDTLGCAVAFLAWSMTVAAQAGSFNGAARSRIDFWDGRSGAGTPGSEAGSRAGPLGGNPVG